MKNPRKFKVSLIVTILLVSFTCSFLSFNILPVEATTETKIANAVALGGYLEKNHDTSWTDCKAATPTAYNGSSIVSLLCGDVHVHPTYFAYEAFLSFDTSIFNASIISSAILEMQISADASATDFDVNVYSGQNAWNTTQFAGWDTCSTSEGAWRSTSGIATNTLYNMTILNTSISLTGNTQFRMISSRYATNTPTGNEYVTMHGHAGDANLYVTMESAAPPNSPTYSSNSTSTGYPFGGNSFSFYTKWNASTGNLSKYIFSWDNGNTAYTNDSAVAFGVGLTEDWSNVTKSLNATGDCTMHAKIYANNTSAAWNVTATFTVYVWKSIPAISDHIVGQTVGFAARSGIYHVGAHHVIFVAYQNSSTSPWDYYVAAYDVNATAWYVANSGLDSGSLGGIPNTDGHYNPQITVLANGKLMLLMGYTEPLRYSISTYSSTTETNTSKLISNWGVTYTVNEFTDSFSYPETFSWSDKMILFGREGASSGGNLTMMTWKNNITKTEYVSSFNNSYDAWYEVGASPWLGNNTDYIALTEGWDGLRYEGWFGFPTTGIYNGTANTFEKVNLKVLSEITTDTVTITLLSGATMYNYTLTTGDLQTSTFDVTSILTTAELINTAKILVGHTGARLSTTIVWDAWLDMNYTGWTDYKVLFLPPANYDSTYWHFTVNSTGTVIGAGFAFNITLLAAENIYAMWSNDKGVTWSRINETATVSLPYVLTPALIANLSKNSRCGAPSWDENNNLIIGSHFYTELYAQVGSQFNFIVSTYNSTLGSSTGVWATVNATDQNNVQIKGPYGMDLPVFLDSWFGRPSIWLSENYMCKFVRIPSETSKFLCVVNDTNIAHVTIRAVPILDSLGYYQILTIEQYMDTLGNMTVATNKQTFTTGTLYGARYTAVRNATLDFGFPWAEMNFSVGDDEWQMAIYGTNLGKIAETTKCDLTSGGTGTGWGLAASFPYSAGAVIVEGQDYWIFMRNAGTGATSLFYADDASHVNYSAYVTGWAWSISQFPSNLTGAYAPIYQNRTYTVIATPSIIHVRGLGVMEFTDTGTNTTTGGAMCQFRTYVKCDNGLSYSYFRSNNTGVWDNTTYGMALSGTYRYVYFNVTLNSTASKVQWEIWVNDSNNNLGHTPTQTLTLNFALAVTVGNSVVPFINDLFGKALGIISPSGLRIDFMLSKNTGLLFQVNQVIAWFAGLFRSKGSIFETASMIVPTVSNNFWKAIGFQTANTISVYDVVNVGKGFGFLTSGIVNGFSSIQKGMALAFQSLGSVRLWDSGVMLKALGFQNAATLKLLDSTTILKALGYLMPNIIKPFDSATTLKAMGFQSTNMIIPSGTSPFWKAIGLQPAETLKAYDSNVMQKAIGFLSAGATSVFSTLLRGIELTFTNIQSINLFAGFQVAKEQLFTILNMFQYEPVTPSASLFENKAIQFSVLGEITRLFSSLSSNLGREFFNYDLMKMFSSGSFNMAKGFNNYDVVHPSGFLLQNKAIGFNVDGLVRLLSDMSIGVEKAFGNFGTINPFSFLMMNKALDFKTYELPLFFDYLSMNKAIRITVFEFFNTEPIRLSSMLTMNKAVFIAFTQSLFGTLNIQSLMIPIGQIVIVPSVPISNFWKILAMFSIIMLMTSGVFLVEKQRKMKQQQNLDV